MGRGAGGPTRWGGADPVGVESGDGSFYLRAGAGAVRFPYLLF